MSQKKGQVVIFLIVATIILLFVGTLLILSTNKEEENFSDNPLNAKQVKNSAEICLQSVGQDAVKFIALRGGYFNLPDEFISPAAPLYIKEGVNLFPSRDTVEREISKYIEGQIKYCLDDYEFLVDGEPNIETIIIEGQIIFTMSYPVQVQDGNEKITINIFRKTIEGNRLQSALQSAKNMTLQLITDPDNLCLNCLFLAADRNDFRLNIESTDGIEYLFSLRDNSESFNFDSGLEFNFAYKLE